MILLLPKTNVTTPFYVQVCDLQDHCTFRGAYYADADGHADGHADFVAKCGANDGVTNLAPADRGTHPHTDGIAHLRTDQPASHGQSYSGAYHWLTDHAPDPRSNQHADHDQANRDACHEQPDGSANSNSNLDSQRRTNRSAKSRTYNIPVHASLPNCADNQPHHGANGFAALRSFSFSEHSDPSHR